MLDEAGDGRCSCAEASPVSRGRKAARRTQLRRDHFDVREDAGSDRKSRTGNLDAPSKSPETLAAYPVYGTVSNMKLAAVAAFLACPTMALADDLVASKQGLICKSPKALAALTLPDGSSRTQHSGASAKDNDIARAGGCFAIQIGQRVTAVERRANTSIVISKEGSDSEPAQYIIPNIDFTVGPPRGQLLTRRRCPARLPRLRRVRRLCLRPDPRSFSPGSGLNRLRLNLLWLTSRQLRRRPLPSRRSTLG